MREVERSTRARAIALLLVGASMETGLRADTMEQVQRAASLGEFGQAQRIAELEPDALASVRAQVWLAYRARDFTAVQALAERGLALDPTDLWLCERSLASALWQRDAEAAANAMERLSASLATVEPSVAEPFLGAVAEARTQVASLLSAERVVRAAALRSKIATVLILGAVLAALAWLGLRPARA